MLEFRSVSKAFSGREVLRKLSFKVAPGERFFILGKSGVGKSVALKTALGLIEPDSGEVWVGQTRVEVSHPESVRIARETCGMVFQFPALFDSLTLFENVAYGLRLRRQSEDEITARVEEVLKSVGLDPATISDRLPHEVSTGVQKRVSLARTLAPRPKVLLFDEPTTSLDPLTSREIFLLMDQMTKKLGVTAIVVSHDIDNALQFADRVLMLDGGEIVALATPQALKLHPSPLVKAFLQEALPQ